MKAYYSREDKTAVLDPIKAQLPFSEGKYQLLNSESEIPFLAVFYHLNFQLPHPNRSNSVSSHKYPLKDRKMTWESRKLHSKDFCYFFLVGCPCYMNLSFSRNKWSVCNGEVPISRTLYRKKCDGQKSLRVANSVEIWTVPFQCPWCWLTLCTACQVQI